MYENTDGAFSEVPAGLTGVMPPRSPGGTTTTTATSTSCSPDSLSGGNPVAKVYENTDGAFSEVPQPDSPGSMTPRSPGGTTTTTATSTSCSPDTILEATRWPRCTRISLRSPTPLRRRPATSPQSGPQAASRSAGTRPRTPRRRPPGLTYNLRVGTTPGGSEITAAMADDASGYRRVPALGNANHNLSWTLDVPAPPVYWSVQALDAGYAGSAFATETAGPFSEVPRNRTHRGLVLLGRLGGLRQRRRPRHPPHRIRF